MQYNARELIETLMAEKSLNQMQLAQLAKISQSTISRLRRGDVHERSGGARLKLLRYAKSQGLAIEDQAQAGQRRIMRVLEKLWDGSPGQLEAIVKVLQALAGLRSATSSVKGKSRDGQRR